MDSGSDKKRMNVEGDRLSNLPDDIIHKILSFLDITQTVETSVLSSRWRYIWTSIPALNFSTNTFHKLPDFSKFVTHVLSARNNQIDVSSVKLAFRGKVSQAFVKRIMEYAISHNVQQLNINCLHGKKKEFPLSLFNSHSLKHLSLNGSCFGDCNMSPPIWELPALDSLNLYNVTLYDDTDKCAGLFSNCVNLKNLILYNCKLMGLNGFNICHPRLSSLTLYSIRCDSVNVVSPQLKNLSIEYWRGMFLISTPNLSYLHYKDNYYPLDLSADFLHLEKVDICISCCSDDKEDAQKIVSMLQQLHSVKALTLTLEVIESLSSSVELISHLPSPFTKLKSLKIYPDYIPPKEEDQPEVVMPSEVKNYLLDSSSGVTFTMVSHEEIRADRKAASARKLMRVLQVELNRLKENSETDMDQDKAPMAEVENHNAQPDTEVKWHFEEKMTRANSFWEGLNEQLEKRSHDVGQTISMLQKITKVMAKLPTSHRDKLEARFSGLCSEAGTVMDNMMEHLKNQCDKKKRFKCLLFDELATTSQSPS